VSVLYDAVNDRVKGKDPALAKAIKQGSPHPRFIDRVDVAKRKPRENLRREIDELAAQAKEKSDKLVPQVEQAAAILISRSRVINGHEGNGMGQRNGGNGMGATEWGQRNGGNGMGQRNGGTNGATEWTSKRNDQSISVTFRCLHSVD